MDRSGGNLPGIRSTDLEERSGIAAFLFTDIEGSTSLWQAGATDMSSAVADHGSEQRSARR